MGATKYVVTQKKRKTLQPMLQRKKKHNRRTQKLPINLGKSISIRLEATGRWSDAQIDTILPALKAGRVVSVNMRKYVDNRE